MILAYAARSPGAAPAPTEKPAPDLGPDQLLVAVEACGLGDPELRTLARADGRCPGGAAVGVVTQTGSAATDHLGRRVVFGPAMPCGECDLCRRGRLAACPSERLLGDDLDGALASHVVVRRRWVTPLDGPLSAAAPGPEAALLGREVVLAYALHCRVGTGPGEVSVWLGDDVVSHIGADLAARQGAKAVVVGAADLGRLGDGAGDGDRGDGGLGSRLAAFVRGRLGPEGEPIPGPALWRVLVTGENPGAHAAALALAAAGATVGLSATAARTFAPDPAALARALAAEAVLLGVAVPHPDLVPEVCALAARGGLSLAARTVTFPIEALGAALAAARAPAPGRAVVVTFPPRLPV
jgi:6-hydroxycyclohex-1-ene-1-carbonyl-CoA dehydrogenase